MILKSRLTPDQLNQLALSDSEEVQQLVAEVEACWANRQSLIERLREAVEEADHTRAKTLREAARFCENETSVQWCVEGLDALAKKADPYR